MVGQHSINAKHHGFNQEDISEDSDPGDDFDPCSEVDSDDDYGGPGMSASVINA